MFNYLRKSIYLLSLAILLIILPGCQTFKSSSENQEAKDVNFANVNYQSLRFETYKVIVEKNQLIPQTLNLPANIKVQFLFTSIDQDYQISLPMIGPERTVKKGQTESFIWQTREGSFPIFASSQTADSQGSFFGLVVVTKEN